jgi:catechol 2,3-dioxygenase-like lactoylglutathione lyase family enzyme
MVIADDRHCRVPTSPKLLTAPVSDASNAAGTNRNEEDKMTLNHLNLTVDDAQASADFLTTYFGMTTMGSRGKNMIFLTDKNSMVLALMKGKDPTYPANFHIGFIRASRAEVDATHAQLVADGFAVDPPSEQHAYTFYVKAPGGFIVECLV